MDAKGVCSILVPVDGSESSARAVRFVIRLHPKLAPVSVHLLHVLVPPVPGLGESEGPASRAHADKAITTAKALLDAASIPYVSEVVSGYVGSMIVAYARDHRCDGIVIGTRGMGSSEQLLGSIARQVVQLAALPVTLVK